MNKDNTIEKRSHIIDKTTRKYVMKYLHWTGEQHDVLTDEQDSYLRYYLADGFGNLSEQDLDREIIQDMMWDWSHVRDSSVQAFSKMAGYILKEVA